jgi:hypothetical protein
LNTYPNHPTRRHGRAAHLDLGEWQAVVAASGLPALPPQPAGSPGASPPAGAAEVWAVVIAFNRASAANDPERRIVHIYVSIA